jgi:hypothetical protein
MLPPGAARDTLTLGLPSSSRAGASPGGPPWCGSCTSECVGGGGGTCAWWPGGAGGGPCSGGGWCG